MSLRRAALLTSVAAGLWACGRPAPEPMAPVGVDVDLPPLCTEAPPPATPTRLLTREEYNNTVRDLLGDTARPADAFPKEPRVLGFENNPSAHRVNPLLLGAYLDAAEALSARAVAARRPSVLPCIPLTGGEALCGKYFLDAVLPRAYRRPPTEEERAALDDFFARTLEAEGFDAAVEWTLQVILQSPQFLYRVEKGHPGPDGRWVLGGYEMASRLSYFLWSSMPDDALLAAAASGELDTPEGVLGQARRMLADPKAEDTLHSFFRQWLELERVESLEKDPIRHPDFTPDTARALKDGLDLFVSRVFWRGAGDLETLLRSPVLFVNEHTAPLYGLEAPAGGGFVRAEVPPQQRSGLLTQPALLAALAGPVDSSPVKRGVFLREQLLCQQLQAPPADVAITAPEPDPNATTRERFAAHTENATCAACHQLIDPVGFGLEKYDALGRYRETENGLPVEDRGEISGIRDQVLQGPFHGATELAEKLSQSVTVKRCFATQWYRFALGRGETAADGCSLKGVQDRFLDSGGDMRELLLGIVASDAFRTRAAPAGEGS